MYNPTREDRGLAETLLTEEAKKYNITLTRAEIDDKVQVILSIAYSLKGSYEKETLRAIVDKIIIEKNMI